MIGPVVQAPEDVLMAYGWLARVMIVMPARNMVVGKSQYTERALYAGTGRQACASLCCC